MKGGSGPGPNCAVLKAEASLPPSNPRLGITRASLPHIGESACSPANRIVCRLTHAPTGYLPAAFLLSEGSTD